MRRRRPGPRTEEAQHPRRLACEMVLPLRWVHADPEEEADLAAYLHRVARWCDVTVVDGSPGPQVAARRADLPSEVRVLHPSARWAGANGKVTGAMTGIEASRHPVVVLADDDVRYRKPSRWIPPGKGVRFRDLVDDLSREILHKPASDRLVETASRATGCRAKERITLDHELAEWKFPRLLAALLDTPDHYSC